MGRWKMPGCPVRVGRGESVRLGKGGEGKETHAK